MSHIGDLDGDGRPELAFASPNYDYSGIGESEVFILEPDEGTEDLSSAPYWHLKGGGTSARLGLEMCGAGDVNLDGYADLLIANPANSGDKGVVYLIDDRFARPEVRQLLPTWWDVQLTDKFTQPAA